MYHPFRRRHPFRFFFFMAAGLLLCFFVVKFVFMAFVIGAILMLFAAIFSGIRRLFGFKPKYYRNPRFWAEPLDANRQPFTYEPIAPRWEQYHNSGASVRIITIK